MKKAVVVVALISLVGLVAYADQNARAKRVTMSNLAAGSSGGGEALHTMDYFFAGPAGTYTWNGMFYMSNMFKPDPAWYPFGIVTVEVNPARIDGLTTSGDTGTIDGVRVFTGAGPTVNVVAESLGISGTVGTWRAINFPASTAVVIDSGDFWAGIFNSTGMEGGLQGEATGWVAPPAEPIECIDTASGSPTAAGAGPWLLHDPGDCGDQYGTVSAVTVRVTVDDSIPVELMGFTIE